MHSQRLSSFGLVPIAISKQRKDELLLEILRQLQNGLCLPCTTGGPNHQAERWWDRAFAMAQHSFLKRGHPAALTWEGSVKSDADVDKANIIVHSAQPESHSVWQYRLTVQAHACIAK